MATQYLLMGAWEVFLDEDLELLELHEILCIGVALLA